MSASMGTSVNNPGSHLRGSIPLLLIRRSIDPDRVNSVFLTSLCDCLTSCPDGTHVERYRHLSRCDIVELYFANDDVIIRTILMINLMRRYVYLTSTTKILRNVSQRRMTRMSYRVAKRGIGATGREGKVVEYAGDAYSQYVVLGVGKIPTSGQEEEILSSRNHL